MTESEKISDNSESGAETASSEIQSTCNSTYNQKNNTKSSSMNNNNSARSSSASNATAIDDHVEMKEQHLSSASKVNSAQQKIYGWRNIQPRFLQRFCSAKWALFWLCWGGAMQGLIVNGFINVVITTIERRFGLRSRQTGLVASGYDIASFVCLVPVTYFGGRLRASKPRWIAWGVILMGVGSLTFALPRFLAGPYRAATSEANGCWTQRNVSAVSSCERSPDDLATLDVESYTWTVWIFFTAQLLLGAGASPLYTLGVTYIDENVSKKMSSVYLGIYYTMAIMGPAVGYVLGGQLLLIYTDFMTVDAAQLGLTSQSNVWIGAWWIGFVFAAGACVLLAIPIFGYPSSLPGSEVLQQEKISEAYNSNATQSANNFSKLKELPRALLALLKNPTFFFLNLAGASEGLIIAGFAAFLPKQIENQFSITPVWAAMIMGLITVTAGGGGTFLGGYLVKRYNLSCAGIIKMCLIVTIVATCFSVCFLLSCPNLKFAGVTTEYAARTNQMENSWSKVEQMDLRNVGLELEADCNLGCHCNRLNYDPICGVDGIMYYSPCHAGCEVEQTLGDTKHYFNCSCIRVMQQGSTFAATNTMCESRCGLLPYFVAVCFVLMVFTFLATMPALSATLRCVHDDQRSFALGIQWIKVRLLGTIPAPMIFGTLIDETCILWQESCDNQEGACSVHDNKYMSKYMWLLALVAKSCSVLFFFCAWWFYIPPKNADDSDDVANKSTPTTTVRSKDVEHQTNGIVSIVEQQVPAMKEAAKFIDENFMNESRSIGHAQKVSHNNSGGRF